MYTIQFRHAETPTPNSETTRLSVVRTTAVLCLQRSAAHGETEERRKWCWFLAVDIAALFGGLSLRQGSTGEAGGTGNPRVLLNVFEGEREEGLLACVGRLLLYDVRSQEQGSGGGADVFPQLLFLLCLDGHVQQGECACVCSLWLVIACGSSCGDPWAVCLFRPRSFFVRLVVSRLRNSLKKYLTVDC